MNTSVSPTSVPVTQILGQALRSAITRASQAGQLGALTTPEQVATLKLVVEIPNDRSYGDYACPSALGMAKICRLSPAQIANVIATEVNNVELDPLDVTASVAGKGFINFQLGPTFLARSLEQILNLGDHYGKSCVDQPERILLEFVSANPTGPLHVGHGRWAAVGSTLANLLRWTGHQVDREFYINDAGNQMQILGKSLQIRVQQLQGESVQLPEDSYQGSYLVDMAKRLLSEAETGSQVLPTSLQQFTDYAYTQILTWHQETLHQFKADFEQWFSERQLHTPDPETHFSPIDQTLQELENQGYLYQATAPRQEDPKPGAEEAVFFKSADMGDDKDRVVKKGDGSLTYLAADIAYHRDKVRRGYHRLITILGSDHHGYVARLKAGVAAFNPDVEMEAVIGQFVKLFRLDPETQTKTEVRMSKRTGNFVSLNDLIEDDEIGVGVDAARWFLLSNSMDTAINFDLDLARDRESLENPVVYAHYSHARCCTLLRRIEAEAQLDRSGLAPILNDQGKLLFVQPEERILLLRLLALPDEIQFAAQERAPHRIIRYTESLASDFNKFYDECRIFPLLQDDPPLALARLQLVKATRQVLFNLLTGILGISAPESM